MTAIVDLRAHNIYIDGSCFLELGRKSGFAGVLEYPMDSDLEHEEIFKKGYFVSTNNRMELMACIEAFKFISITELNSTRIIIYSDSQYVVSGQYNVLRWRGSWTKQDGSDVRNIDLWKKFLTERGKLKENVQLKYIKGKSTPLTKEVDKLAKSVARKPLYKDSGFIPGKVGTSIAKDRSQPQFITSTKERLFVHIYRKQNLSKDKDIISFDLFSEVEEDFVYRYNAVAKKTTSYKLHRGHYYRLGIVYEDGKPLVDIFEEVEA